VHTGFSVIHRPARVKAFAVQAFAVRARRLVLPVGGNGSKQLAIERCIAESVAMMDADLRTAHCSELVRAVSPAYTLFDLLANLELDTESRALTEKEVARFVDLVVFQEIDVRAVKVRACAEALLALPYPMSRRAIAAWCGTIEAAATSRRMMQEIAHGFDAWIAGLTPPVLEAALDLLPALGSVMPEIGADGVREILAALAEQKTREARERLARALRAYGETTGPIVLACCRLGRRVSSTPRAAELDTLAETAPVAAMEESYDSERLLPALAALCDAAAAADPAAWEPAWTLGLRLAQQDHAGALRACRSMAKRLGHIGPDKTAACLDLSIRLLDALGPRVLGYCLRRLPGRIEKHGVETMQRFVQAAVEMAATRGITAAEAFLEQKTRAARDALAA